MLRAWLCSLPVHCARHCVCCRQHPRPLRLDLGNTHTSGLFEGLGLASHTWGACAPTPLAALPVYRTLVCRYRNLLCPNCRRP